MHDDLIHTLQTRFSQHMHRHPDLTWDSVLARLNAAPASLAVLRQMEDTGGEPDVIGHAGDTGAVTFCDCSAESPIGRRSLCFDAAALAARKANKPAGNAVAMAQAMGIALLTQAQYRQLQELEPFDRKTSSWIATPDSIRALGGALFCDRRYEQVFVYHNGAESYYASRGFRGLLKV
ncbi:DUF4256 domain-containing protein [Janthinobacterium lividum]|uniref:DUF4256 domain-containing protein n=1 Tax=Janthinobacterium lividum TaxID=29581 RepID=UPI0005387EF2|nr:DUF4256 domain-containing protein [Janthinobacterium lividum]KHA80084.1 hypothetical protein NC77_04410 [Janthinobacterium lividum]QKY10144.1 DUF4256 domain-containing protein [Janthinobacterium lividum]